MRSLSKLIKSNYVREIERKKENDDKNSIDHVQEAKRRIDYLKEEIEVLEEEIRLKKEKAEEYCDNKKSEAEDESQAIVQKAEVERDELLEQAYQKSQEVLEESRNNGYEEGYQSGYEEGKKNSDELIDEANDYKKQYWEMREKALRDAESDFVNLAIGVIDKIFNRQLEEEDIILDIVKNAIESIGYCTSITIRVSEDDYDVLEISRSRILAMFPLIDNMDIKTDFSLTKGDCVIDSEKGSVDASVRMQLDQIKELVMNLLQNE
jgi:flagellar assembly protein FliH